jgi:hypothetical protein
MSSHTNGHAPTHAQDTRAQDTVAKGAKRQRAITITLHYHGAPVTFHFSAADNVPIVELEQSIDTLLRREGWGGVAPTPAPLLPGPGKTKAQYVDAIYDGDGEACCPVHRTPLADGRYGRYCPARARDGEATNAKGYCALRFKD